MANVVVHIELSDGDPSADSLATLGEGRRVSTRLGATLVAVLSCEPRTDDDVEKITAQLGRHGADAALWVVHPSLATPPLFVNHGPAVLAALRHTPAQLVLLPPGTAARDMGPRLALELGGAYAGGAQLLQREGALHYATPLAGLRQAHGAELRAAPRPLVLELARPGDWAPDPGTLETIARETIELDAGTNPDDAASTVLVRVAREASRAPHRLAVGAGGGVASAETFGLLEKLVELTGAELVASATACGRGLAPETLRVGLNGRGIEADVYLAFGVSGSPRHLAAISTRTTLIAINRDEQAPIFEVAHYGLVADAHQVAAQLVSQLQASEE